MKDSDQKRPHPGGELRRNTVCTIVLIRRDGQYDYDLIVHHDERRRTSIMTITIMVRAEL